MIGPTVALGDIWQSVSGISSCKSNNNGVRHRSINNSNALIVLRGPSAIRRSKGVNSQSSPDSRILVAETPHRPLWYNSVLGVGVEGTWKHCFGTRRPTPDLSRRFYAHAVWTLSKQVGEKTARAPVSVQIKATMSSKGSDMAGDLLARLCSKLSSSTEA